MCNLLPLSLFSFMFEPVLLLSYAKSIMRPSNPAVQAAVDSYRAALLNDPKNAPSQRQVAEENGIAEATLLHRLNGINKAHEASHTHLQKLSTPQEEVLVDFIYRHTMMGVAITREVIIDAAEKIR
jgi:hypothetical protein